MSKWSYFSYALVIVNWSEIVWYFLFHRNSPTKLNIDLIVIHINRVKRVLKLVIASEMQQFCALDVSGFSWPWIQGFRRDRKIAAMRYRGRFKKHRCKMWIQLDRKTSKVMKNESRFLGSKVDLIARGYRLELILLSFNFAEIACNLISWKKNIPHCVIKKHKVINVMQIHFFLALAANKIWK